MNGSDIICFTGDDLTWQYQVINNTNPSSPTPYNITGWEIDFTIKAKDSDPDTKILDRFKVTSHDNPTQGLSHFTIPGSKSINYIPGTYRYMVRTKDGSGYVTTYGGGFFIVKASIPLVL